MGLTPVDPAELATVVTTLAMTTRPTPAPLPPSSLSLTRWRTPEPERYRMLFRRVGAPWLWFSRLVLDDAALARITHDARVEVHAVIDRRGIEVGMLELDFRAPGRCEIAYLGLVPELAGRGHGRWLMAAALTHAWRRGIERVGVNTCTLDHPAALPAYRRAGFAAVGRTVETFADPRLVGLLPRDSAPQVPLLS